MKIKKTNKLNLWKFTKGGINFWFRFWDEDIRALNPKDNHNASLKFSECSIGVFREDLKIDEAILQDEKSLSIFLEHLADAEIAWLKQRDEITESV